MNPNDIAREITLIKRRLDEVERGRGEVPLGMSLVAETVLSGSVTIVTFSDISQSYRDLILTIQGRTDVAAEADAVLIRLNGDTGGNYDQQRITANHTTLSGLASRAGTSFAVSADGANARASNFTASTFRIFGYTRTDAEKWAHSHTNNFGDISADTDLAITLRSHRWRNTAAITSITLLPLTGPNLVSGSRFTLYGVY